MMFSGPTALYSEALRLLTEARRVDEKNLEKIRTQAEGKLLNLVFLINVNREGFQLRVVKLKPN